MIGSKSYSADVVPIVPQAMEVNLDYPGFVQRTLPFGDGLQDAVPASCYSEYVVFDAIGAGFTQDIVPARGTGAQRIIRLTAQPHELALNDFGHKAGGVRRVLALMLRHFISGAGRGFPR